MYLFLGKYYIKQRWMQQLSNTCWLTELGCQEFIEHENEAVLGVLSFFSPQQQDKRSCLIQLFVSRAIYLDEEKMEPKCLSLHKDSEVVILCGGEKATVNSLHETHIHKDCRTEILQFSCNENWRRNCRKTWRSLLSPLMDLTNACLFL